MDIILAVQQVAEEIAVGPLAPCDVDGLMCVGYNPVWDLLRISIATAALIMALFMIRIGVTRKEFVQEPYTKWTFVALSGMGVLGTIEEIAIMGNPLVLWRLPFIAFTVFFGWKAVLCKL